LTVAWEIEPGREVLPATRLPAVTESGWDDPQTLGAFLDAVRWGTVASADDHTLQAPLAVPATSAAPRSPSATPTATPWVLECSSTSTTLAR